MTDIINLNSIRSDNCDCNKPKPNVNTCGCHSCNQQTPSLAMNLGELYFKVKNLFSELKSEWQRAEARSNLGISDIIGLELTDESQESGGTNTWTLITLKGGIETKYKLFVRNGEKGESATIEIVSLQCNLPPDAEPIITNLGTKSHALYMINLPRGKQGEPGEQGSPGIQGETGKSAYELAVQQGFMGSLDEWLASLKGLDGSLYRIKEITIAEVVNKDYELPNGETFSGKVAIWKVKLHNDTYFNFWAPLNVASGGNGGNEGNDLATDRYNVFLFTVKSYSEVPDDGDLNGTLFSLRNNISGLNEDQAKANGDGWKSWVEVYDNDTNYVFMASCVVTNGVYGPWSVVRLTPKPGKQGSPGNPGSTSQGLIGPTIQMRGEYDNNTEYVNETYKPYSSNDEIHYIDVVFYKSSSDEGNWYSVKPGQPDGGGVKTKGNTPEDTRYWTKATAFDFAFINELITNLLSSRTIDAEEIRIHDRRDNGDIIVAGMTSGNPVTYHDNLEEELIYKNTNSPVRIWAGTSFNTKGTDSNFDITTAKFRVHLNGYLYALNADVEGTIQANTLRLGKLLNINNLLQGTFLAPKEDSPIMLPKLVNDRVQLFYLLTNLVVSKNEITVNAQGSDLILESSKTNTSSNFKAKYEKLYILFGMDIGEEGLHTLVWFVIELDMRAATSIIPGVNNLAVYGTDYTGGLNIKIRPNEFYSNKLHFNIELSLSIRNLTDNPLSVLVPFMLFSRKIQSSYGTLSTAEGYITIHFTQIFLTCLPNKTTTIFAALEDDGNNPAMEQGGHYTTILYETGVDLFEENDGTTQQAIISGTWSDTTPETTFDGFTADVLQTQLISLDYLMPGIIVVNKQGGSTSTQLNSSNNSLEALMNFYQDLGITITDNETE